MCCSLKYLSVLAENMLIGRERENWTYIGETSQQNENILMKKNTQSYWLKKVTIL